jgi:hypothetical protein
MEKGLFYSIITDHAIFISQMPNRIVRDTEHNLHNATDATVEFKDGYKQYHWHGVSVSKKFIIDKESITKGDILQIRNAKCEGLFLKSLAVTGLLNYWI